MAIYRLEARIIGRSMGKSAVGAAAYRSGRSIVSIAAYRSAEKLKDYSRDITFDYSRKERVEYSAVLAPDGAPAWVYDREKLWNAVEAREDRAKRPHEAQLAREVLVTLPRELDEAVKVDGAGSFTALWRILVPISIPGLVSVGIYTFMIAWNEYLFALTLTRTEDMRTVPIGIQLLMGQHSYEWNEMMAMSILGCVPVLVLFLFFQRFFIGGMTAGSVKS